MKLATGCGSDSNFCHKRSTKLCFGLSTDNMKIYLLLVAMFGAFVSSHSLSAATREFVCFVENESRVSTLFRISILEQGRAKVSEKWADKLPPIEQIWNVIYSDDHSLVLSETQKREDLHTKILLIDLKQMAATYTYNITWRPTAVYQGTCM